MKQTLSLLKSNLANTIDPRTMTKIHPRIMTGAALISGFAAVALFPSFDSIHKRRLRKARRRARKNRYGQAFATADDKKQKAGLSVLIIAELMKVARQILLSLFTSAASRQSAPEPDPMQQQPDGDYAPDPTASA